MMVFMQVPKKAMHHISVYKPCGAFHHKEGKQYEKDVEEPYHKNTLSNKKNNVCIINKCTANRLFLLNGSHRKTVNNNAEIKNQHA